MSRRCCGRVRRTSVSSSPILRRPCSSCHKSLLEMSPLGSAAILASLAVLPIACRPAIDGLGAAAVRVTPGVTYSMEDGERYHREAPDTFEIPSLAAREALEPGQIVKLMFNISAGTVSQV